MRRSSCKDSAAAMDWPIRIVPYSSGLAVYQTDGCGADRRLLPQLTWCRELTWCHEIEVQVVVFNHS